MTHAVCDEEFLRRALDLAREGIALASPNPYVGAVIVDSKGGIAGAGAYTYDGVKHAEILALEQAGNKARAGTLYINLEPHAHQGRTRPCTDALIEAGISRVVACMADPNPKVSGRGFEQLRAAKIQVEIGQFEKEARQLNEAFARYIRHRTPLVTLKSAMTLDGKIAAAPSRATHHQRGMPPGGWITGELARAHVQEQRHESDAILTGVGTVLADDPLLTDRTGQQRRRTLLRVVLDSHLRLPLDSRLVQSVANGAGKNEALVFCSAPEERKKRELEAHGIRIEHLPRGADGRPDLRAIMRRLGELEITSVMIESGATLNAAALASDIVDKVFFYYAPKIFGQGSVPFAASLSLSWKTRTLRNVRLHHCGEDVAMEGYLRDPYTE